MKDCRVLDLGIITAGAASSAFLADLGAEVIKIESPSYRDAFRDWVTAPPAGTPPGAPSPFFAMTNRGKLSASIDFKRPEGRVAFLRLVAKSDIVVENFRRGVLDKLAIGFAELKAANPAIILASISSQGETGPDAGYISFGSTLEATGGLAAITGYAGGPPVASGVEMNYPDQVVALFAAGMIVTAWRARKADAAAGRRRAVHLDLSQRELTTFLISDAFAETARGRGVAGGPERRGNGQADVPVQDCMRSADGTWIAVTVTADKLRALAALVGIDDAARSQPGAAGERRLRDALEQWVAARGVDEAVAALRHAGIAAARVRDGKAVHAAHGTDWRLAMQRMGDGLLAKGFVLDDPAAPLALGRAAPPLGADTADVLARVAGYSAAEIAALAASGVIGLGT